jgi:hypothetical protein
MERKPTVAAGYKTASVQLVHAASLYIVGTKRVAEFLGNAQDETTRADAAGAVRSLLRLCREGT